MSNRPISTYRLQFQPAFGFDDAIAILPYLKQLGITHVYSSPLLQAAPGSTHGYDVVDHAKVNVELGGEEGFARFATALKEHDLGFILDIVPNHMAIPGRENAWWWDVLKRGQSSEFAKYFDIDWREADDKVLMPILGDHYGVALDSGDLKVERSKHDDVVLRYFDNEFPLERFDDDIDAINGNVDALDALIQRQHYRLAYWRVATDELDYRRFFDINSLVALRMDRPEVFEATHKRIIGWVHSGVLDGVRIDHIDGLLNPASYLQNLRDALGSDAFIVVEKILKLSERLPASWPVAGTTGYDLLAYVNGLFVESNGEVELTRALVDFTGDDEDFTTAVWNGKVFVVDNILRSDVERLAAQFRALAQNHRSIRDYTSEQFHGVVRAMLIAFPVYRTYCVAEPQQRTQTDVEYIAEARRLVLQSDLGVEEPLLKFFCDVLAMKIDGEAEGALAMRFQQTSGPVMAKGMEDTAFYRSIRLVSLNEVGCEPEWFGVRPDDFHAVCAEIQRLWPNTLVASTTHDTKRSEDVRYRLHAISEIPDEWSQAVQRWAAMNERHRRPVRHEDPDGASWPSRRDEYLFYQSLVGAFPLSVDRAVQYMMKATKEAKLETSWTEPNAGYDNALEAFVQSTLDNMAFVDDVEQFVERLKAAGEATSLAATVVKLTMPGAPDIYQGAELWTLTLVDPDNRQPVDFDERISALRDGKHPKMVVTHRLLQLRADHPEWFDGRSDYAPLWSTGDKSAHVLAYRRAGIVVVVPRLLMGVRDGWMGTTFGLPPGEWRNVFTEEIVKGGQVELETLFSGFPVAVLVTTTEGEA